jgi:NAD(P)-dependent dehydrogenase (short-subunit alcohol dehydrogenase family)
LVEGIPHRQIRSCWTSWLVNNAGWSQFAPHRDLEGLTEELLDRTWAVNVSPMGRIPTVEDVANAALYPAADATGVTAQTIFVDCGVTALQPSV